MGQLMESFLQTEKQWFQRSLASPSLTSCKRMHFFQPKLQEKHSSFLAPFVNPMSVTQNWTPLLMIFWSYCSFKNALIPLLEVDSLEVCPVGRKNGHRLVLNLFQVQTFSFLTNQRLA